MSQTPQPGFMARKGAPLVLVLVGAIFCTVGTLFITSQRAFDARSEAADITVSAVERERRDEGDMFRPTFQAVGSDGQTIEYTGTTWVSPKPHNEGDIVQGRVDWANGEIRSARMMMTSTRIGIIFAVLGGILMIAGLVVARLANKRTVMTR